IERLLQPLLANRPASPVPETELTILLAAFADLRNEIAGMRSFSELASCGALDRFRTIKRRLGDTLLHPRLLPAVVETTVAIKNRFRELWEDEEAQLLNDTNRVMELKRQLAAHPEVISPELREALDTFASVHRRVDQGRQDENVRREDVLELRRTLNVILNRFDSALSAIDGAPDKQEAPAPPPNPAAAATAVETTAKPSPGAATTTQMSPQLPTDPLLHEYLSKIMFVLELVGPETSPAEAARAKEIAGLRLEPWEGEAGRKSAAGLLPAGTLANEMARLWLYGAALRIRMDEEAREIDRLSKRGADRLSEVLEHATQSLERAAEIERRFGWFIDDALYRGDTEHLERLFRSRFRLLRAYSGLWLIHNERGGLSPF
ncbi:MAG: hypothetical protein V1750_08220, partial [Acidobacteriota bacterium]